MTGRFVITSRRLVYLPEVLSEWLGATRLSFDYVDVERFHGTTALKGGKLSLLCTNGTVYHFAILTVVLEPMLEELRKITFGAEEEMVEATASQLAIEPIKINRAKAEPKELAGRKKANPTTQAPLSLSSTFCRITSSRPHPSRTGLAAT